MVVVIVAVDVTVIVAVDGQMYRGIQTEAIMMPMKYYHQISRLSTIILTTFISVFRLGTSLMKCSHLCLSLEDLKSIVPGRSSLPQADLIVLLCQRQ